MQINAGRIAEAQLFHCIDPPNSSRSHPMVLCQLSSRREANLRT